jgi:hypothetical protein
MLRQADWLAQRFDADGFEIDRRSLLGEIRIPGMAAIKQNRIYRPLFGILSG